MEIIQSHTGHSFEVCDETYFHLTSPNDFLMHNVRLYHGLLPSVSVNAQTPGLTEMTTTYAGLNVHPDKERLWEAIRAADYANKPSRLKTFYCFQNANDAEMANAAWFANQRKMLEIRPAALSTIGSFDAKWLNCHSDLWEENAHRYWSGDMTDEARLFPRTSRP